MRIRCTRGMSLHTFHGHFFVRFTDLLSLPNVNPDSAFGMQVRLLFPANHPSPSPAGVDRRGPEGQPRGELPGGAPLHQQQGQAEDQVTAKYLHLGHANPICKCVRLYMLCVQGAHAVPADLGEPAGGGAGGGPALHRGAPQQDGGGQVRPGLQAYSDGH